MAKQNRLLTFAPLFIVDLLKKRVLTKSSITGSLLIVDLYQRTKKVLPMSLPSCGIPNILLTRTLFFGKKSLYFQYINSVVSFLSGVKS
jgi:hypothetical protein